MTTTEDEKVLVAPAQEGDVPHESEVTGVRCKLLKRTVELKSLAVVGLTTIDPRLENRTFWVRHGKAPREVFNIIWSDAQKRGTPPVEITFKVSRGTETSKFDLLCLVGEDGEFPIFSSEQEARAAEPPLD